MRKAFGTRRVGHTGTLDPFATGLLLVLVGRATRLTRFLSSLVKHYTGVIRLGLSTSTDDPTGEPQRRSDRWQSLADETLAAVLQTLTGRQLQRPPEYSAKKVGGRPAHRRARRGERVTLNPQWVEVHRLAVTRRDAADVAFEAAVGTGTYLRALARDFGERLGCAAHLRELRRVAIGPFRLDAATSLDSVVRGTASLWPPGHAVQHLPRVTLDAASRAAIRQGRPIDGAEADGPVALVAGNELVAVAEARAGQLHPRVVLDP